MMRTKTKKKPKTKVKNEGAKLNHNQSPMAGLADQNRMGS